MRQNVAHRLASHQPGAAVVKEVLPALVRAHATLADAGITVTVVDAAHTLVVGSTGGVLEDRHADAVRQGIVGAGLQPRSGVHLPCERHANGDRDLPYSLVSALELPTILPGRTFPADAIVLNQLAATDTRRSRR